MNYEKKVYGKSFYSKTRDEMFNIFLLELKLHLLVETCLGEQVKHGVLLSSIKSGLNDDRFDS